MGDTLPLNIATQAAQPYPLATSANTISISTMLLSAPDALTTIARPVTVTGTIIDMLMSGEVSLRTAMGTIKLSLQNVQNDTIKVLMDLLDTPSGKSPTVELFVQPGSVPKQALLIVPKSDPMLRSVDEPKTAALQIKATQSPDTGSQALKVTVLPDDIDSSAIVLMKKETVSTEAKNAQPAPTKQDQTATAQVDKHITSAALVISDDETPSPKMTQPTANTVLTTEHELKLTILKSIAAEGEWPEKLLPDQIKATVIGKNANGQTLLRAEDKTLFVHDKIDLPAGTKLVVTAQPADTEAPLILPLHADHNFEPARELSLALQTLNEGVARTFLANHLPTPKHHFAGTALFLLSAIQGGHFDEWMGPQALQTLEREGKLGLKNKLIEALQDTANTPSSDTRMGEWKTFPIPLHYGQAFEMLRLYVHRDPSHEQNQKAAESHITKTRFVISVTLSRLGAIQLDGLCQKKQLDFVVRSERELPDHLTMSIRDTALKSLEAIGLTGTILFQTGRQNWVVIEDKRIMPSSVLT